MNAKSKLRDVVFKLSHVLEKRMDKNCKDNLLSTEEFNEWVKLHDLGRKIDPYLTLIRLAAFNLVLKTMIYEKLATYYELDDLNEKNARELLCLFDILHQKSRIFCLRKTFLDYLVEDNCSVIQNFLPQIRYLVNKIESTNEDIIGKVYEEIVPQEERRKLGQFWTPSYISNFMVSWAIRDKNSLFFDPAVGSGVFLISALNVYTQYGMDINSATSNLYGLDISPLCVLMATTNLLIRAPLVKPNIVTADFLEISKLNNPFPISSFNSIVCNPPYSRHHELDPIYKEKIAKRIKEMTGLTISRLSSSFLYFFILASQFLDRSGRMAFIMPYEAFEAFYSVPLKELLLTKLKTLKAIIFFDEKEFAFPGVETAACITLLKGSDENKEKVKFIKVEKWPGLQTLMNIIERSDKSGSFNWGHVNVLPYSAIKATHKWSIYANSRPLIVNSHLLVPLRNLAKVMRGIATGANEFFVLSDSEISKWGIEREFLKPVIMRTRDVQKYVLTIEDMEKIGQMGKKRWLFYCALDPEVLKGTKAFEYIKYGESRGYPQRSLIKLRKRWYELEKRDPPPIIFTYLTRGNARFIYNKARALALNVFLLIYPKEEIAKDEITLKALLAYLNSDIAKALLRTVGRTYGGKTLKLEPRELDALPTLDVRRLNYAIKKKLAILFDGLCHSNSKVFKEKINELVKHLLTNY